MDEPAKAKYDYLENVGCLMFFVVGSICSAAVTIMNKALDTSNAFAGSIAVVALSGMGVGIAYFLVRHRDK